MTFARKTQEHRERRIAQREENLRNLCRPVASLHRGSYSGTTAAPAPKDEPLQHQGYMRLVRQLSCAHCGHPGPSQFCHSDEGKGTGIKSDCRLGWPGCPGCHAKVGTERIYPKQERRDLEAYMAAQTRKRVIEAGEWPKTLPRWEE
jgi:hypothetical protein